MWSHYALLTALLKCESIFTSMFSSVFHIFFFLLFTKDEGEGARSQQVASTRQSTFLSFFSAFFFHKMKWKKIKIELRKKMNVCTLQKIIYFVQLLHILMHFCACHAIDIEPMCSSRSSGVEIFSQWNLHHHFSNIFSHSIHFFIFFIVFFLSYTNKPPRNLYQLKFSLIASLSLLRLLALVVCSMRNFF